MRCLLLAILVLSTLASTAHAQGTFFDKGESGMGIMGGILSNNDADGWQLSVGGTARGVLDFSAAYARVEESNIYAFGASYYLFRPRQLAKPIAISLGAKVELSEISINRWHYTGDEFYLSTEHVNAQMVILGIDLHSTLASSESALIEVSGGVGFSKLSYDGSDSEIEPVLSGSLPMVFGNRHGTRFIIAPALSSVRYRGKYESTLGITVGILIQGGGNRNFID